MNKIIMIVGLLFSVATMAAPVCDFPYDLAEEEGVVELRSLSIEPSTTLTALQQKQVITTASKFAGRNLSLKAAIKSLKNNSEGGDLTLMIFSFKGVVYSIVEYYPGGNPVGLVFKGTEIVAERQDGDMVCDNL